MKETHMDRGAGILLPVSSLPSPYGIGTLGRDAYEFIDFLKQAGQKYWQVLPLGPTSFGDSPYQSLSAFAGNPYFIDLDMLIEAGLLSWDEVNHQYWGDNPTSVSYDVIYENRFKVLKSAYHNSRHKETPEYQEFVKENSYWLEDYCMYMALKFHFHGADWLHWPEDEIRLRKPELLCQLLNLIHVDGLGLRIQSVLYNVVHFSAVMELCTMA